MIETEEYQTALLLACFSEGDGNEWVPIKYVMERAARIASGTYGTRELAYSTQRNAKNALIISGDLLQKKGGGRHYYVRLTEKGLERVENPPEPDEPDPTLPDRPFRFGGSHRLPKRTFGDLMKLVVAGEVELIAVDRRTKTRAVGYWDE